MNSTESLKKQRENIINNQRKILELKTKISDLKINRNVAIYAHSLDEILLGEEIHGNLTVMNNLNQDSNVQTYIKLRKELESLEREKIDYYKDIQTKLKDNINKIVDPNIYVYYGRDEDNEIITKNIINSKTSYLKQNNTVILPLNELESKRKIRHFYNRTRFKYLEELTRDSNLSIEKKNLGKVKILSKGRK